MLIFKKEFFQYPLVFNIPLSSLKNSAIVEYLKFPQSGLVVLRKGSLTHGVSSDMLCFLASCSERCSQSSPQLLTTFPDFRHFCHYQLMDEEDNRISRLLFNFITKIKFTVNCCHKISSAAPYKEHIL